VSGPTPEEFDQASIAELRAGRLPLRAQHRLAAMRAGQAFTSDLTVDEHHAVRSVGFSPVGQVLGSCVYHIGWTGSWNCGWGGGGWRGWASGYTAAVTEAEGLSRSLFEARDLAMRRMQAECAGLGGDGVVAVRLVIRPFPAGGVEFQAIGTAVRADGEVRPRVPFTSDLTGQDFAKLLTAGWVPAGMVLGLAVTVRHDDYRTLRQTSAWTNQEVTGHTELVRAARALARERLRADCARHGAEGVVVRTMTLQVSERACSSGPGDDNHDHLAEAMVIGTAITPFRHAGGNAPPAPLQIMRLSPRARPSGKDTPWIPVR
jgi:uncharacterized protein YbjQ (UPF0145 family)